MKKLILLLFILTSPCLLGQNSIIYKNANNANINKVEEEKKGAAMILNKSYELMNQMSFELQFNQNESYFYPLPNIEFDNSENNMSKVMAKKLGFGSDIHYFNTAENLLLKQTVLQGDQFLVTSKIDAIVWTKTDETKEIAGYICFKATTTQQIVTVSSGVKDITITAWYTPEIPIPFGPASFGGLPGLILEVSKDSFVLYASAIRLNQPEQHSITRPEKGIKITEEKYQEIMKNGASQYKKPKP